MNPSPQNEDFELDKKVFEALGWEDTYCVWVYDLDDPNGYVVKQKSETVYGRLKNHPYIPHYELEYVLRQLPRHLTNNKKSIFEKAVFHLCVINGNEQDDNWIVDYFTFANAGIKAWYTVDILKLQPTSTEASTPRNAALKLALQLATAGVLKKEK